MAILLRRSSSDARYYGEFNKTQEHECDNKFWVATEIYHLEIHMACKEWRDFGLDVINNWIKPDAPFKTPDDPNFDDVTHDCIEIDFKCQHCCEEFSVTYEFGSAVYETPGSYASILKCKKSRKVNFPYSKVMEVFISLQWSNYDMKFRNCKHWAGCFYTRLIFYDLTTSNIKKILEITMVFSFFSPSSLFLPSSNNDDILKNLIEEFTETTVCLIQTIRENFVFSSTQNPLYHPCLNGNYFYGKAEDFSRLSQLICSNIHQIPENYKWSLVSKFLHFFSKFTYDLFLIDLKFASIYEEILKGDPENLTPEKIGCYNSLNDLKGRILVVTIGSLLEFEKNVYYLVDMYGKNPFSSKSNDPFFEAFQKNFQKELRSEEKIKSVDDFFATEMPKFEISKGNLEELMKLALMDKKFDFLDELDDKIQVIFDNDKICDFEKELEEFNFDLNFLEKISKKDNQTVEAFLEAIKFMLNLRGYFKAKNACENSGFDIYRNPHKIKPETIVYYTFILIVSFTLRCILYAHMHSF